MLRVHLLHPAVIVALFTATSPIPSWGAKPVPCDGGRFLVAGDPLVPGSTLTAGDAVVVGASAAIDSGCANGRAKIKATKKATMVTARWTSCTGIEGKATLKAKVAAGTCAAMTGTFRAKKAKVKRKFTAERSRCGDGLRDVAAGEVCDGADGCAKGTCNDTCTTCTPTGGINTPPTASFTVAASGTVGVPVVLDGSASSDPDGDPLVHTWDFGDGGKGGVAELAHLFAAPDTYSISLTVADGRGGMATTKQSTTISAGPTPGALVEATGTIRTAGGGTLASVSVTIVGGGDSGTTDSNGVVTLDVPSEVPSVLRLARSGYVTQLEVIEPAADGGAATFIATMKPGGTPQTLADAAAGGTVTGDDGAILQLGPGALVDGDGNPVSGPVELTLSPVDPTDDPQAFPGRFAGILPNGEEGLIVSGGTVDFDLGDVDLAPGATATIEMPLFATLAADGNPLQVGDTIPLWALDENTGMWVQEGVGTVVSSVNSPTGLALRGQVAHFSWWNIDHFDSPPYKPKPKCCIDTNLDGMCEDLSKTGYCWHYGSNYQGGAGGGGGFGGTPLRPAFAVEANLPFQGGVLLPLPKDQDFVLYSTYEAGTYAGYTTLNGAGGLTEDQLIVLQPVDATAIPITIPHDQVYDIDAVAEVDRYVFTAAVDDPIYVTVGRNLSSLNGQVFVDGPGGNDFGPATFNSTAARIGFLAPVVGNYRISVEGTSGVGTGNAGYRLEVEPTGTYPIVTARTPAANATGVATSSTISATFTVDIDPTSVTTLSFKVESAGAPVAGTRQVTGNTITFTPTVALSPGVAFTVTLSTGILAQGGTGLALPVNWVFSTADMVGVTTVIAAGTNHYMAIDEDGNAFAIFLDNDDVYWSRYQAGQGWSAQQLLRASDGAYCARIAVEPDGDSAIAVWRHEVSAGDITRHVYASRWTAALGWSTPAAIDSMSNAPVFGGTGNGDQRGLELAMDASGNAIAVWSDAHPTNDRIAMNRYTAGVGWATETELFVNPDSVEIVPPAITMNTAGEGFITWAGGANNAIQPRVRHFTGVGSTLDAEIQLDPGGSTIKLVSPTIDPAGNGFVMWKRSVNVLVRRWDTDDNAFESAVTLNSDDGTGTSTSCSDEHQIHVATDGTGLATGCSTSATSGIWRVNYTPDMGAGTWSTPVVHLTSGSTIGYTSTMSPDGDGWVANYPLSASPISLWRYRKVGPPAGWDAMATPLTGLLGTGGAFASNARPRVYAGPSNHVFVMHDWYDNTVSEGRIGVIRLQ